MENWENNILADKLNNLQDLPAGYTPNLSSKWEIVEAGLPGKKRRIPLYVRWSVAAAVLLAIGLVWMNVQNNQVNLYAVKSADTQNKTVPELITLSPNTTAIPVRESTNQGDEISLSSNPNTATIVVRRDNNRGGEGKAQAQNNIKQAQPDAIAQESISLAKEQIVQPDTAVLQANNEVAVIATQEKLKPAKKKIYQRDFNDGVLAMDTGFTNTSTQHFSIKLPFSRKNNSNDALPAQRLQLKTSL